MVKEIEAFQCEICGERYFDRGLAEQCGRLGQPEPKFEEGTDVFLAWMGEVRAGTVANLSIIHKGYPKDRHGVLYGISSQGITCITEDDSVFATHAEAEEVASKFEPAALV